MPPSDAAASDWPEPNLNVPPDDSPEGHRIRSRTTWLMARHDYLQGDSAEQVCARYGLKVSTLRDRAKREKWRRIDQPDPDPVEDEVDDSPVDCVALADEAMAMVRAALRRRRAAEAASWMRVHDKLAALVAAREDRARRSARVERTRGSSSVGGAMAPLFERLAAITAVANNQARLKHAYSDARIPRHWFDGLSVMNETAVRALGLGCVDPHCSHPDFSEHDDPEPEDPGGREPSLI